MFPKTSLIKPNQTKSDQIKPPNHPPGRDNIALPLHGNHAYSANQRANQGKNPSNRASSRQIKADAKIFENIKSATSLSLWRAASCRGLNWERCRPVAKRSHACALHLALAVTQPGSGEFLGCLDAARCTLIGPCGWSPWQRTADTAYEMEGPGRSPPRAGRGRNRVKPTARGLGPGSFQLKAKILCLKSLN